jgi:hypothetical protein
MPELDTSAAFSGVCEVAVVVVVDVVVAVVVAGFAASAIPFARSAAANAGFGGGIGLRPLLLFEFVLAVVAVTFGVALRADGSGLSAGLVISTVGGTDCGASRLGNMATAAGGGDEVVGFVVAAGGVAVVAL